MDDSFWTLEDSKDVSIILQKDNKMEVHLTSLLRISICVYIPPISGLVSS